MNCPASQPTSGVMTVPLVPKPSKFSGPGICVSVQPLKNKSGGNPERAAT
ncbi:MAG: hypothetical protein WCJ66_04075 [Verrucomicrobiota bacterium]